MPDKTCTRCGESKDVESFSRQQAGLYGRASACRECRSVEAKARRELYKQRTEMPTSKVCPRCELDVPIEQYSRSRSNPDKVQTYCVHCQKIRRRERYQADPMRYRAETRRWALENPEKARRNARRSHLRATYGISLEDYEAMLEAQGGRCAICGTDDPGRARGSGLSSFAVDHCHDTGKVRAILCHPCNAGIGLLGEEPDRLIAAAEYLRKHHALKTLDEFSQLPSACDDLAS